MTAGLVFLAVMGALGLLFAAGLRLPVGRRDWPRWLERAVVASLAVAAVLLANVALYRHDLHLDLTESGAYTPAPELEQLARGLAEDVELVYFFQKQDQAAAATKTTLEIVGRTSPRLHVRTVDPDLFPGLASRYGVRGYNVAVLRSGGRVVQVQSSSDRDIALGIVRVTRAEQRTICFAAGHGEYDIDNFEFHTHFEGEGSHSHGAEGAAVVQMTQHGLGRLRRALEGLGYATRKVTLATDGRVPPACSVLVDAGPRTLSTPAETAALESYLAGGGSALLLYDLDSPLEESLAALLARVGVVPGDGAIVDPLEHYFTDEQMVAVSRYADHPVTRGLALTFFPGVRPLRLGNGQGGVTLTALASSSPESYVRPLRIDARHDPSRDPRGPSVLAAAAEGSWPGREGGRAFRLVVVGDLDFASNSFLPYMSNADLAVAALTWLVREDRPARMRPPMEVLPRVALTARQVTLVFVLTVLGLPGLVASVGGAVWWRRRR